MRSQLGLGSTARAGLPSEGQGLALLTARSRLGAAVRCDPGHGQTCWHVERPPRAGGGRQWRQSSDHRRLLLLLQAHLHTCRRWHEHTMAGVDMLSAEMAAKVHIDAINRDYICEPHLGVCPGVAAACAASTAAAGGLWPFPGGWAAACWSLPAGSQVLVPSHMYVLHGDILDVWSAPSAATTQPGSTVDSLAFCAWPAEYRTVGGVAGPLVVVNTVKVGLALRHSVACALRLLAEYGAARTCLPRRGCRCCCSCTPRHAACLPVTSALPLPQPMVGPHHRRSPSMPRL